MNSRLIPEIVHAFGDALEHSYNLYDLNQDEINQRDYKPDDIEDFIYDLIEAGNQVKLVFMPHHIEVNDLPALLDRLEFPMLIFRKKELLMEPVLIWYTKDGVKARIAGQESAEVDDPMSLLSDAEMHRNKEGKVIFLTAFPFKSTVNDTDSNAESHPTPVKRLLNLLSTERRDIGYVYIYAIAVGIISLSLPLGTQAIVGFISGGMWFNSVVLLISLVIVGVLVAGGLQIMQISMVEILQRRVFAKISFEFAYRIPRFKPESLFKYHPPELINRFFDVVTIQKGLPKLLIDLSTAVLQIFFSLVLLSFYHPFFVFFGLVLVTSLVLIFYFTGPKGQDTAIVESKYKYEVAFWLEELARTISSFKMAGTTTLPMKKADFIVNNYLKYRKEHFRILIKQFSYVILFKVLIIGGLLILGTLLVIDREITLGQFVASEIIIVLILNAVEKIVVNMDIVYDMLAAVDKIGHVTDLPLEKGGGIKLPSYAFKNGIDIRIKNLKYTYPSTEKLVLNKVNLDIKAGEKLCIAGYDGSGKSTLVNIIDGLLQSYEGIVTYNQFAQRDIDVNTLRDHIAKNVSHEGIFEGTVLENVTLGKPRADFNFAIKVIEDVGLSDEVNQMPNGLSTKLISGGKTLSTSFIYKLLLVRCIVKKPEVMILNDFFQFFERSEKIKLIRYLTDPAHKLSLIIVTNDPLVMKYCDRVVIMKEGSIVSDGKFDQLISDQHLQEVVVNE
jgi:ABC-type bacteriocin/lantibiotic exporter with double-glycine peptidase domain